MRNQLQRTIEQEPDRPAESDISISGDVIGRNIISEKNILVYGNVTQSQIISNGGSIYVGAGVLDDSLLDAANDVRAGHVENSVIKSRRGSIYLPGRGLDAVLDAYLDVFVGNDLKTIDLETFYEKGRFLGGYVRAGREIWVRDAGGPERKATVFEISDSWERDIKSRFKSVELEYRKLAIEERKIRSRLQNSYRFRDEEIIDRISSDHFKEELANLKTELFSLEESIVSINESRTKCVLAKEFIPPVTIKIAGQEREIDRPVSLARYFKRGKIAKADMDYWPSNIENLSVLRTQRRRSIR